MDADLAFASSCSDSETEEFGGAGVGAARDTGVKRGGGGGEGG